MRESGEALGRYLGAYLQKDWQQRLPEDKGAWCVRYFGHWATEVGRRHQRRQGPPYNSRFGWLTPRAQAWRELVKQVVLVLKYKGASLGEHNVKDWLGPKWAWKMARLFESVRFEVGDWQPAAVQAEIAEHNSKVQARWLTGGGHPAQTCWWHVTEITLDHLRPSPAWKAQMEELQLAKDCEVEIRRRLRRLAAQEQARAEQLQVLGEVAATFRGAGQP